MFKSIDRTCMCSHKKSDHKKNIFHTNTVCNICKCYDYMRNDKPLFADKIMLFYGIFLIGVFSIFFVCMSSTIFNLDNTIEFQHLLKILEITNTHIIFIFSLLLVFYIITCFWVFVIFINSYFYIKRRKNHSKT